MSHQRLTALCLFVTACQTVAVTRNVGNADNGNRSRARGTLIQSDTPPGFHFETMREVRKRYSPNSYRLMSYDEARRIGVLDRSSRVGGGVGKRNSDARNGGKRGKRKNNGNNGTAGNGGYKPSSSTDDRTPVSEPSAKPLPETPANVPKITALQPDNSGPIVSAGFTSAKALYPSSAVATFFD